MPDINPAGGNPTPPVNPNPVNPPAAQPTAPMVTETPKPPMVTPTPTPTPAVDKPKESLIQEIAKKEEATPTPAAAPIHQTPPPAPTPTPAAQPVIHSEIQKPVTPTPQPQPVVKPQTPPPAPTYTPPAAPIRQTPPPAAQPQTQPQTFSADLKPGDKVAPTPVEVLKKTASNQPQTDKRPDGTPLDGEEKIFAAIGYIGILALVPLLMKRKSEFCQHHGRQALVVAIIFVFLWMLAAFSYSIAVLTFILQLVAIVGGFLLAFKGDWFRIPGIYELSLKLDWQKKLQTPPQS